MSKKSEEIKISERPKKRIHPVAKIPLDTMGKGSVDKLIGAGVQRRNGRLIEDYFNIRDDFNKGEED